jgi:hypothetical protein
MSAYGTMPLDGRVSAIGGKADIKECLLMTQSGH